MNMNMRQYIERRDECVYLSKEKPVNIEVMLTEVIPDMERENHPYATLLVKSLLGSYLETLEELDRLKENLKELSK